MIYKLANCRCIKIKGDRIIKTYPRISKVILDRVLTSLLCLSQDCLTFMLLPKLKLVCYSSKTPSYIYNSYIPT